MFAVDNDMYKDRMLGNYILRPIFWVLANEIPFISEIQILRVYHQDMQRQQLSRYCNLCALFATPETPMYSIC